MLLVILMEKSIKFLDIWTALNDLKINIYRNPLVSRLVLNKTYEVVIIRREDYVRPTCLQDCNGGCFDPTSRNRGWRLIPRVVSGFLEVLCCTLCSCVLSDKSSVLCVF